MKIHIASGTYIIPLQTIFNFWYFYLLLSYYSTVNFNQSYMIFKTVEWIRHILIILTFLFSPPWRWPHEWPKQVGEPLCHKIASIKPSAFLGLVIHFTHLINDRNMGHNKLDKILLYGLFRRWSICYTNQTRGLGPHWPAVPLSLDTYTWTGRHDNVTSLQNMAHRW
jgi:hypothetical protein